MDKLFAALAVLLFSTVPSAAMSGAEWGRLSSGFKSGYAWGFVDALINLRDVDADNTLAEQRATCLKSAGIESDTFYDALTSEFARHPFYLTQQVGAVVITTLNEICPLK